MRRTTLVAGAIGMAAQVCTASAQHREAPAHEHGRGTLNVAIEAGRITLELEAPGADIVGFEHAATTPQQATAMAKAKQLLLAPLTLFRFPPAADCAVSNAQVEFDSGDHDHGERAASAQGNANATKRDQDAHAGFQGRYSLNCTAPINISGIEFDYFKAFAGAQKLDVNVITSKGQSTFEVTRTRPRIVLSGMM